LNFPNIGYKLIEELDFHFKFNIGHYQINSV